MKHFQKALVLLLILALALPFVCACKGEDTESSAPAASTPDETSTAETEKFIAPEVKDLGGREINVYCWDWSGNTIRGYTGEILYDENSSANVDVAKKKVIDRVQTDYNCTIQGVIENSSTWLQTVQNMILTGNYTFDLLFNSTVYCANMVSNDLLTDLTTVPTIHLENPWWDQNAVQDLSIAHRLYYVCGDINTYDNLGTWCVLFNKTLKSKLNIQEDFYQMVDDGEWTLDKLIEICQGVTVDTTGDGVIDEHDQWAFGTETYNIFVQVVGGGLHVVQKDSATDLPFFTVDTGAQQTYNALDKVITFYNSKEVMVANGGKYDGKYDNVWEGTVNKAFIDGRELFYMCGLINVAAFRDMSDEFGILPIPKTFATQENYYHTVSTSNSSYLSIPVGVGGLEDLGLVVEALSMHSRELVTPEFYDVQLKYRDSRDSESGRMLDLIFATRSFDLGPIYNWGNIMSCYYSLDNNLSSKFESVMTAANQKMDEMIQQMLEAD